MLTSEEIVEIRKYWSAAHNNYIEQIIRVHEGDIEMYQNRIADKREFIKLLEAILEERVLLNV